MLARALTRAPTDSRAGVAGASHEVTVGAGSRGTGRSGAAGRPGAATVPLKRGPPSTLRVARVSKDVALASRLVRGDAGIAAIHLCCLCVVVSVACVIIVSMVARTACAGHLRLRAPDAELAHAHRHRFQIRLLVAEAEIQEAYERGLADGMDEMSQAPVAEGIPVAEGAAATAGAVEGVVV